MSLRIALQRLDAAGRELLEGRLHVGDDGQVRRLDLALALIRGLHVRVGVLLDPAAAAAGDGLLGRRGGPYLTNGPPPAPAPAAAAAAPSPLGGSGVDGGRRQVLVLVLVRVAHVCEARPGGIRQAGDERRVFCMRMREREMCGVGGDGGEWYQSKR